MESPVFILGVRRSGTTLLRVILDRSSEIAIPDESYFVPQLAHRHRGTVDPARFLDDLRRLRALPELGLSPADVASRLRPGMPTGAAIATVFEAYAAKHGKLRWGDKTPMYMQHLGLLDGLFSDAVYVHLIRDGRDAAISFLQMPVGIVTRTWAHPRGAAGFASQWRTEVLAARALGRRVGPRRYLEVRYEDLVADPSRVLRSVCAFAQLPFEPAMLDYAGEVDVSNKPHQQRLRQPPTVRVRDWRNEMNAVDLRSFEALAGDLLRELGYDLADESMAVSRSSARLELGWYRARIGAWKAVAYAAQRSPFWHRRHPRLV